MNLTLYSPAILLRCKPGKAITVLVCLAFLLLLADEGHTQQAPADCRESGVVKTELDWWDSPPAYSTGRGWVYGRKIGVIPKGTQVQICEKRRIGFFFSKQLWLRIQWESKVGWIYGK
jgi:hypothetical protein